MRVAAISRVRNEQDVIEAFVRHTLAHADHLFVYRNRSTDATPDILRALVEDGLSLTVLDDPSDGWEQAAAMTRLMHLAAETQPDWILPVDADEFVVTDDGRPLAEHLALHAEPVLVPWSTYVPDESDDPAELNPAVRLTHRLAIEAHPWAKVVVPGRIASAVQLTVGNHDVVDGHRGEGRERLEGVRLCHLPVRDPIQYAIKIAIGNLGHLARSIDRNGLGFHYMEPFELLVSDADRFMETYVEAAKRFAVPVDVEFDPVVVRDPLAYAGGALANSAEPRSSEPLRSVLEFAVQLARRHARLKDRG